MSSILSKIVSDHSVEMLIAAGLSLVDLRVELWSGQVIVNPFPWRWQ